MDPGSPTIIPTHRGVAFPHGEGRYQREDCVDGILAALEGGVGPDANVLGSKSENTRDDQGGQGASVVARSLRPRLLGVR